MKRMKHRSNWRLALRRGSSASWLTLAVLGGFVCGFDGCRRQAPKQGLSDINRPRPPVVTEPLTNVIISTNLVGTNAPP
jgi:hypothetical protein